ncbi:MAG TPA: TIGR01777 family oxidoreductase [Acidobacteriota bacterium]|nr:TIGR01777 family oxidoreductase [Acidobacteriota bacterium]
MKILVTGATGFVGSALCRALASAGHAVTALSRNAEAAKLRLPMLHAAYEWEPRDDTPPAMAIQEADAIVHLAGESVAGRWGRAQRRSIHNSRVVGTQNLVEGIRAASPRPTVLISASAIGFYGDRGDDELTELDAAGDDFLAGVCSAWESAAQAGESLGVRVVRLRTGIVLGRGGGALEQMLLPARLGMNGPLGSGRQWWSWIHIDDLIGIIRHGLDTQIRGALNASSPAPVRQQQFAEVLGAVLHRPSFVPAPALALKIVLGGFSAELLTSKRVLPGALQAAGYEFRFPQLRTALDDLLA